MKRHEEFMAEAVRLATESVENGWGGPFGAVITRDDEIIATQPLPRRRPHHPDFDDVRQVLVATV